MEIVCETLNAIFDIYSEETYNAVLAKKNAVDILEEGYKVLGKRVKALKKEPRYTQLEKEHFKESLLNLGRFVVYKRDEMKQEKK